MNQKQTEEERDLEVEIGDMLAVHITVIESNGVVRSHFDIYPRKSVDKLRTTSMKLNDVVNGYIETLHKQSEQSIKLLGELTINDKYKRVEGVN